MQSQSSAPLYDLWGLVPNGDHETIAFRESELSELIAASSESNPAVTGAVTEYASETAIDIAIEAPFAAESTLILESTELETLAELPIEATVVIPTLSPFVVERPSSATQYPALSYSVPDVAAEGLLPLPLGTRVIYALSIAILGVVCGIVGATSLLQANAAGAGDRANVSRVQPRISVDDKVPVVVVVRDKAVVRSAKSRH